MKRIICTFLVLGVLATSAQKEARKQIRLIALGERPQLESGLPEGHLLHNTTPPKGLVLPGKTVLVSGDQATPFQMDLRAFTKELPLNPSAEKLEVKTGKAAKSWVWPDPEKLDTLKV